MTHRGELGGRVVLGDHDHQARQDQADHRSTEELHDSHLRVELGDVAHEPRGDRVERDHREHAGDDHALIERAHDFLAGCRFHEEAADD